MPRTEAQNSALRTATRSAIETAAVRVFARSGFAAASIRQVADEAGLSVGSIYRHWVSKEELFDHLLGQAARGLEAAAAGLSGPGDPVSMIRSFTETYLADLTSDDGAAEFYVVINQAVETDIPQGTTPRLQATRAMLWNAFAALLERGQAEGQIARGDPARMTAHYFAMLAGLTTMRLALRDKGQEPDAGLILRMLTGGPR
ncbi:TetR/AcrR family transcriptional regulator [Microbacterium sp. K2]|uniref:TetR/AcrR family transcriptional regulator n=1 Tax=Microbacterium sp. K2 TaxID=3391827 RepID=UPI003EDACF7B